MEYGRPSSPTLRCFTCSRQNLEAKEAVSNINSAYTLANLASELSQQNQVISSGLVAQTNSTTNPLLIKLIANQTEKIGTLQTELGNAYTSLGVLAFLFVIALIIIGILLGRKPKKVQQVRTVRKTRARRRSRR